MGLLDPAKTKDYPINILLVEDNEADVIITLRAFQKARLKNNIYVVRDGQEALDFLYHAGKYQERSASPHPDLILMDINMPKLGGFEVLSKIKLEQDLNFIPIIMMTSSTRDEDVIKSYKNGAVSFITKPVGFDDFMKVIEGFNFYWQIISKLPMREEVK